MAVVAFRLVGFPKLQCHKAHSVVSRNVLIAIHKVGEIHFVSVVTPDNDCPSGHSPFNGPFTLLINVGDTSLYGLAVPESFIFRPVVILMLELPFSIVPGVDSIAPMSKIDH